MELVGPCWSRHNSGPCKSTVGITVLQHPPTLTQHRSGNSEPGGGAAARGRRSWSAPACTRAASNAKKIWSVDFDVRPQCKVQSQIRLFAPSSRDDVHPGSTQGAGELPTEGMVPAGLVLDTCWTGCHAVQHRSGNSENPSCWVAVGHCWTAVGRTVL